MLFSPIYWWANWGPKKLINLLKIELPWWSSGWLHPSTSGSVGLIPGQGSSACLKVRPKKKKIAQDHKVSDSAKIWNQAVWLHLLKTLLIWHGQRSSGIRAHNKITVRGPGQEFQGVGEYVDIQEELCSGKPTEKGGGY